MILTIFRKELLDIIRDRRTVIASIAVPLLLFPVLGTVVSKVITSQQKQAKERKLDVALIDHGQSTVFRDMLYLESDLLTVPGDFRIREDVTLEEGRRLILADSLTALIYFDPAFERQREAGLPGRLSVYFKRTDRGRVERDRVLRVVERFEDLLYDNRVRDLGLDPRVDLNPIEINRFNLATEKEQVAAIVGGILPYLFVLFSMMGCFHPACDLAAGEKERGTLETLLTIPATRLQIVIGKFLVVFFNGLLSAGLSLLGIYIAIRAAADVPDKLESAVVSLLEIDTILLVVSLLIPVTVFFAAVLLSLSIYARSFKEAQSTISPLMMLVIVPIYVAMIPGVRLSNVTALVPILNVSLAMKAVVAGTATHLQLGLVYGSLSVLAVGALYLCARMFERESAVFRS